MKMKQINYLIFLFMATLAGIALRVIQFLYAIEKDTGFYKTENISVQVMNIFIIAVFLILLSGFLVIKKRELTMSANKMNTFEKASSVILLFALNISAIYSLISLRSAIAGGSYLSLLEPIFTFGFVIFICVYIYFDENIYNKGIFDFLILLPVFWSLFRLISTFIKYTGIANISARVFEVIMLSFFVLFFMTYAKAKTGRSSHRELFIFGCCAIFAMALAVIPLLILFVKELAGHNFKSGLSVLPQFILIIYPEKNASTLGFLIGQVMDLAVGLFIISAITKSEKEKSEEYRDSEFNKYEDDDEFYDDEPEEN